MATSVTFETSTIADVAKRALSVAPKKGEALDKAAGVRFEITPSNDEAPVMIRATDLDVFLTEWVSTLDAEGDDAVWRVSAQLLAAVTDALPKASGKTVTFTQAKSTDTFIFMKCGRMQAKCILIGDNDAYPDWDIFDPSDLGTVTALGDRIKMVEWACSRDKTPPMTGVHIDGNRLVASDNYRLVTIPCEVPLDTPITVPAGILAGLVKPKSDTRIGSDGVHLLVMPDDHTQVMTRIYGLPYPPVDRAMKRDYPNQVKIDRDELVRIIQAAVPFAGADRAPMIRLYIGEEEISARIRNEEVGIFADVLPVPGYATHERVTLNFTPKYLVDALVAAPNNDVVISYNVEKPQALIYIDGGSGYEAWVAPRKGTGEQK